MTSRCRARPTAPTSRCASRTWCSRSRSRCCSRWRSASHRTHPMRSGVVNRVVQGVSIYPWSPAPVKTFLGVDGGGTKTEFLLIDESGEPSRAPRRLGLLPGDRRRRAAARCSPRGIRADAGTRRRCRAADIDLRVHRPAGLRRGQRAAAAPRSLPSTVLLAAALPVRQRHGVRLGRRARRAATASTSSPAPAPLRTGNSTVAARAPAAGASCSATRARPTGSRARR